MCVCTGNARRGRATTDTTRMQLPDINNAMSATRYTTLTISTDSLQLEKEISYLQRQRRRLEFVLDSHASRCRHMISASRTQSSCHANMSSTVQSSVRTGVFGSAAKPVTRAGMNGIARDSGRPSSLSLVQPSTVDGSSGLVTTPMAFSTLGLNCIIDGYTGWAKKNRTICESM